MQFISKGKIAIAAATLAVLTPAAALAQDEANNTADTRYANAQQDDDNDDIPWGLLGLLGLAGLLGRKRKEADIHVDARHNNRP